MEKQVNNMNNKINHFFAHSLPDRPPAEWQSLNDHLRNVAELAAEFARPFGGQEWARLAGLWHDLGKYSPEFQKKLYDANGIECHLETKPGRVIHSQAGGHLAQKILDKRFERILCWLIMGHHAGLADYSSSDSGTRALEPKMRHPEESDKIIKLVPNWIKNRKTPAPLTIWKNGADVAFSLRMLFSCLIDADFLDTEAFMDKKRQTLRKLKYPELQELATSFDLHMEKLLANAPSSPVNRLRTEVLEQCRQAASQKPGVFSLTVPTGGGKTLSSLAFALRHAVNNHQRRIIYVIPYTSIIEQTAAVFRGIDKTFAGALVEHHSNMVDEDEGQTGIRSRLAAENWDAPLIVTTAVQFFESLYAARTSRCRRLHNLAESVIICDEAQCLPPEYLRPCVFALRELVNHYGATVVLCTATQPVLTRTESFDFRFREGFTGVREIITDPAGLAKKLKRVEVEVCHDLKTINLPELANRIKEEGTDLLCIVNRKRSARELAELLPEGQSLHLSTNMCAAHRLKVLENIRQRLTEKHDKPLLVVSTSLVEAGVDLDFPLVYRELAGLDSIAQAAGRCNREGRLKKGRTMVFSLEKAPQYVRAAASLARPYLDPDRRELIFSPETFTDYFRQRFFLLGEEELDRKKILARLQGPLDYSFRSAAEDFRLIDDAWQRPIIAPYDEAPELVDRLLEWDVRSAFRKLQRYTVNISEFMLQHLLDEGHVRELPEYPGTFYLENFALYSERYGFTPPGEIDNYNPEATII